MIFENLQNLLCEQLNITPDKVTKDTRFKEDLGVDSLDIVELVMSIEDHFEIEVSDEVAKSWRTVGDVTNYIENPDPDNVPREA